MNRSALVCISFLWMTPVAASVYTVGPGGTHVTVQAAIAAALAAPGSHEIRVATGTYVENLDITPGVTVDALAISGGWNGTFDVQGLVPSVIDGGAAGRVADIYLDTDDSLLLANLVFQNGAANPAAGLLINQYGNSVMKISRCEIINNVADSARSESGGLRVWANETSSFTMGFSRIANNQSICSGTVDCREGGMGLQAANSSQVTFSNNEISGNSVTMATGSAFAGGAYFIIYDSATLVAEDNVFSNNSITGSTSSGLGIAFALGGDGVKTVRRNRIETSVANTPFPTNDSQMSFSQYGNQTGILSDSLIVEGNTKGLTASTAGDGTATVHLVNLTVTDHAGTGIQMNEYGTGSTLTLSNTISVDNGTNLSLDVAVSASNNLSAGSAGFVNAGGGDYSLMAVSPAVNAGSNSPAGGLGPIDIAGNPRINGPLVDIGAYEYQPDVDFADGFESPPP